jgi:hypothetical protein
MQSFHKIRTAARLDQGMWIKNLAHAKSNTAWFQAVPLDDGAVVVLILLAEQVGAGGWDMRRIAVELVIWNRERTAILPATALPQGFIVTLTARNAYSRTELTLEPHVLATRAEWQAFYTVPMPALQKTRTLYMDADPTTKYVLGVTLEDPPLVVAAPAGGKRLASEAPASEPAAKHPRVDNHDGVDIDKLIDDYMAVGRMDIDSSDGDFED